MSTARRIAAMEPLIESEQKLLRYNREILLSGVREVMVKLGKTEVEARRLYTMVCSPDEAALIADDWETNPQTLELLKKLNQPNGRRKLIEAGLQRSADAFGLCFEDWLCVLCLDSDNSLALKLELAQIAYERKMPALLLNFSGPSLAEIEEEMRAARRAEK